MVVISALMGLLGLVLGWAIGVPFVLWVTWRWSQLYGAPRPSLRRLCLFIITFGRVRLYPTMHESRE
jgi:hypothetical protein